MTGHATVRKPDNLIDLEKAAASLISISAATSIAELGEALACLGASLALPYYLLIYLDGLELAVREVCHNLNEEDVARALKHSILRGIARRLIPIKIPTGEQGFEVPNLWAGVAAAMPFGESSCIVVLGRPAKDLEQPELMRQLGLASMAATHSIGVLQRLMPLRSPLTDRERACLVHVAAGFSVKETARRLGIGNRTVEEYMIRCRKRLECETTLTATVAAIRQGWITHGEIEALQVEFSRLCEERQGRKRRSQR